MNGRINDFLESLDMWAFFAKCPHYIIDCNGIVYQILPVNYKGKYCGGIADKNYIQIVVDEPTGIKYTTKNQFTVPDLKKANGQTVNIYRTLIELCSYLCVSFKLDPIKENVILSQAEACSKKIASDYPGINHIWEGLKTDYTMSKFRKDVLMALNNGKGYYHNGVDYSFVFDPEYYLNCYPELKEITGGKNTELFKHFITFGMNECRKGNKDFDVLIYRINNPDLDFGTDWYRYYNHYCTVGRCEDRKAI